MKMRASKGDYPMMEQFGQTKQHPETSDTKIGLSE